MDPKAKPKILYIDDTPSARSLVLRVLAQDYVVLEASDALAGIELAIETEPDLVLIDINLPQLSGREVAARLKTLLPQAVLVAFTADISSGARERALAAGCVGYLTKPLDVDTFGDQIAQFLRGKRETLSNPEKYTQAYQAELVKLLEEKVRELTKTSERNAFLNEQNLRLVAVLQRRQHLLEAAARVSQIITSILDLGELFRVTVDAICQEYGFYSASIYMLDSDGKDHRDGEEHRDGEWAVLQAGSGEAGKIILAKGFRLPVNDDSTVGYAIHHRQAHIVHDASEDQEHHNNPRLPKTCAEAALPLIIEDHVLGALSVHSDQTDAFCDDDLAALQSLANQVAIAINNARSLRDLDLANRELLRTKTFEAIATTTGETIHWVGNKAAPIPSSARRVREDISQLVLIFKELMEVPPAERPEHRLWPVAQEALESIQQQGLSLNPGAFILSGGLESILEDLTIIELSAAAILDVKEDLLGPVRLQQIADLDLLKLINRTVFQMNLPEGVVQVEFTAGLPPVRGDARQIGQVFNNLIKNAWEALHKAPDPQIIIRARLADDPQFVRIQVIDNGPGIPPDLLVKIWVSFFTTKGDRGGTGLGLSACMAIVNQAGGEISCESEVGVGTTFTVLLPVGKKDENSQLVGLVS